jgi:hypothetical protein
VQSVGNIFWPARRKYTALITRYWRWREKGYPKKWGESLLVLLFFLCLCLSYSNSSPCLSIFVIVNQCKCQCHSHSRSHGLSLNLSRSIIHSCSLNQTGVHLTCLVYAYCNLSLSLTLARQKQDFSNPYYASACLASWCAVGLVSCLSLSLVLCLVLYLAIEHFLAKMWIWKIQGNGRVNLGFSLSVTQCNTIA